MNSADNCCGGNLNNDEDFGLNSTFVTNDYCGLSQAPYNFDEDFDMLNSSAYEHSFFGNVESNLQHQMRIQNSNQNTMLKSNEQDHSFNCLNSSYQPSFNESFQNSQPNSAFTVTPQKLRRNKEN
jgi:hypothetical protein